MSLISYYWIQNAPTITSQWREPCHNEDHHH
jgi:hypothetical protein